MNDNNGMRMEKFFHRVVVGVSAALILYGVVLAGTMIYSARQPQAPAGDADFQQLVAEQKETDESFPQMHPVPEFTAADQEQAFQSPDIGIVGEGQKDGIAASLPGTAEESHRAENPDSQP